MQDRFRYQTRGKRSKDRFGVAELATHTRSTSQIRRIGDMPGRFEYWRHSLESLTVVALCAIIDNARVFHHQLRVTGKSSAQSKIS